jgi:hypothetical protein
LSVVHPLIDHIVIAGRDLNQLVEDFTAFGLTPDPGGVHADGQTHNALIGFEDGSYLELIAPVPGQNATNHSWAAFMETNAGVCAWAIRSADIHSDVAAYRARGVSVAEPRQGGRSRPDGVRLEWSVASMGEGALGAALPFLIQDLTPRSNRVPLTASASDFYGVAHVGIRMGSADLFKQALNGWDGYDVTDQPGSGLYGIALRAKNLDQVASHLKTSPIEVFNGHRIAQAQIPHVNIFIIE